MRIAATGPNGQLGSELVRQGCIPLEGRLFDAVLRDELSEYRINPDALIDCAALTDVDYCEVDIERAAKVNASEIKMLSNYFIGKYFIQISTDYVFDGRNGPYGPNDAPNPLSIYGWSKLGGELVTRRHKGPWLIIRTTILFSSTNNNFVAKIIKQLAQGEKVTLYQPGLSGTPTYVPALAREIVRIVKEGYTGIAHIAGNKVMTRLEFARLIAETFGFSPDDIIPADSITVPTGAPRPYNAGLICDHDGYGKINSHDIRGGLAELAQAYKKGEIWK